MPPNPARDILDLFAKQIIHRPLGHAEFDAEYNRLRAALFPNDVEIIPEPAPVLTEADLAALTIKEGDASQTGN